MSRKKTQNKTNYFLDEVRGRFSLKDDAGIGAFFGVEKSTVSAWRTRDNIPKRYLAFWETKTALDDKQNAFYRQDKTDKRTALDGGAQPSASSLIEAVIKFQGECISRLTDDLRDVRRRIEAMEKRCDDCNGQLDGLDDKIKLCETICEMAAQATRKARAG